MSLPTTIADGGNTDRKACVRATGQLVTGPIAYNKPYQATLGTAGTPVEIVGPEPKKRFVVDSILMYANRNVGATVTIYESQDGPASSTQTNVVLDTEIPQKTARDLVGLNMLCEAGHWLNAETDDDDVFITVMGYYVDDVL
jgi:hypothetical protein